MPDLQRQIDQPLFPDLLWSKPVNRQAAKQLAIVGGTAGKFQQVELAYQGAQKAGIGSVRLILPSSLEPTLGKSDQRLYVASTSSGSLDKAALAEITTWSENSAGTLLAGDLSHHSSTVSLIEQLVTSIDQPLAIAKEVVQLMLYHPQNLIGSGRRLILSDTQTLVKLAAKLDIELNLKANAGLLNKVNLLVKISEFTAADVVLIGDDCLIVSNQQASLTPIAQSNVPLASGYLTTYWLQYPDSFKALTAGAYALSQDSSISGGAGGS